MPFRANSAATLLALGADTIVLGRHGELGPIDPRFVVMSYDQAGRQIQSEIAVEDVMAYIRFLKDRAGLSDQAALTSGISKLAERIDPVMLGNIYRTHSHIRDVARRMLLSREAPPNESVMSTIVETLAEKVYAHGHAIGYKEALETGLPVELATGAEEQLLWDLYCAYEDDFKMKEPIDVAAELANVDLYSEDVIVAAVESSDVSFEFRAQFEAKAKRQIPQQLNVAFNLNLQLPPGLSPDAIPASIQQELAAAQQGLFAQAQIAVQEALRAQAPIIGAEAAMRSAKWHKKR